MTTARAIILSAVILALAAGVIAYLTQPRYSLVNVGDGYALRLDRRTGEMMSCVEGACGPVSDAGRQGPWVDYQRKSAQR
ncbi:MAG TPA: hypothetical protein VF636_04860 [Sphingomonas sp.]|jgi:hypothetical protein